MRNYAHKILGNNKTKERRSKNNRKEKRRRNIPSIFEAFQAVKKVFNIDVYNYGSKEDECEVNVYNSIVSTCDTLSENNSNAFHSFRQTPRQSENSESQKAEPKSLQKSPEPHAKEEAPLDDKPVSNQCGLHHEVTVVTTSEISERWKRKKFGKVKLDEKNQFAKGDEEVKTKDEKKSYFICLQCENIVPRAVGIRCRKLECDQCKKCKQIFHSDEFLMIHKAKSHYMKQSSKINETEYKDPSMIYVSDDSKYDEIYVESKPLPVQTQKQKRQRKEDTSKAKKSESNRSSIASRFKDDIATKLAKLLHKHNYSSTRAQKDNSNKHKSKHVPFQWLDDDEGDVSETSMPSSCTLSSETRFYAVRSRNTKQRPDKQMIKDPRKRYEVVKMKNKQLADNTSNIQKQAIRTLNTGDMVSLTKEKLVSMNFLCDHPSVDKQRLAITNNIRLRVVNSTGDQLDETRTPWKPAGKSVANCSSQSAQITTVVKENEKKSARSKDDHRLMRNINNSQVPVINQTEWSVQKEFEVMERNDNNHPFMPMPQETAPGKHFKHRTRTQPLPFPMQEDVRTNFRPPPFACSHLQSQNPTLFRSTVRPTALTSHPCCQSSFNPTLFNYNHRQCVCQDNPGVPKLPWSIMARRMETLKNADPPKLKYAYNAKSPTPSMERNQESSSILMHRNNNQTPFKSRYQPPTDSVRKKVSLGTGQQQRPPRQTSDGRRSTETGNAINGHSQTAPRRHNNFHRSRQSSSNIDPQFSAVGN